MGIISSLSHVSRLKLLEFDALHEQRLLPCLSYMTQKLPPLYCIRKQLPIYQGITRHWAKRKGRGCFYMKNEFNWNCLGSIRQRQQVLDKQNEWTTANMMNIGRSLEMRNCVWMCQLGTRGVHDLVTVFVYFVLLFGHTKLIRLAVCSLLKSLETQLSWAETTQRLSWNYSESKKSNLVWI